MMNKELKRKWVIALKSGKFKQGTSCLERNKYFCCLGVLCKIAGFERTDDGFGGVDYKAGPRSEEMYERLNLGALRKLKLTEKVQNILIDMNDGNSDRGIKRRSFKQIAAYIERSEI